MSILTGITLLAFTHQLFNFIINSVFSLFTDSLISIDFYICTASGDKGRDAHLCGMEENSHPRLHQVLLLWHAQPPGHCHCHCSTFSAVLNLRNCFTETRCPFLKSEALTLSERWRRRWTSGGTRRMELSPTRGWSTGTSSRRCPLASSTTPSPPSMFPSLGPQNL